MSEIVFQKRNLYVYLLGWAVMITVHFCVVFLVYEMNVTAALADSLVFNVLFCILGIGFWFVVEFSGFSDRSVREIGVQYFTLAVVSVFLWMIAGNALLHMLLADDVLFISFLEGTQWVRGFTGISYFVILISVFYLLMRNRQLNENRARETRLVTQLRDAELSMLRSQIRPHFLFNSLNSISALTLQNPGKAHDMIVKLSGFMRYSLTFQGESMSTLEKEMHHILLYLDIEKIRFGDKLQVEYSVDEAALSWPLPAMILQPIIENAVKYGVYESIEPTHISIEIKILSSALLEITISNPFDKTASGSAGTGTGLLNVGKRLETVYRQPGLLQIFSDSPVFITKLKIPAHGEM